MQDATPHQTDTAMTGGSPVTSPATYDPCQNCFESTGPCPCFRSLEAKGWTGPMPKTCHDGEPCYLTIGCNQCGAELGLEGHYSPDYNEAKHGPNTWEGLVTLHTCATCTRKNESVWCPEENHHEPFCMGPEFCNIIGKTLGLTSEEMYELRTVPVSEECPIYGGQSCGNHCTLYSQACTVSADEDYTTPDGNHYAPSGPAWWDRIGGFLACLPAECLRAQGDCDACLQDCPSAPGSDDPCAECNGAECERDGGTCPHDTRNGDGKFGTSACDTCSYPGGNECLQCEHHTLYQIR
jgi:hypothetical protein